MTCTPSVRPLFRRLPRPKARICLRWFSKFPIPHAVVRNQQVTVGQDALFFVQDGPVWRKLCNSNPRNPYRSVLSRDLNGFPAAVPQAGDRCPWLKLSADGPIEDLFQKLSDLHFNLLVFGQDGAFENPASREALFVFTFSRTISPTMLRLSRTQIAQRSFYLIRPDGHTSICGTELKPELLRSYFAELGFKD